MVQGLAHHHNYTLVLGVLLGVASREKKQSGYCSTDSVNVGRANRITLCIL